MLDVASPRLAPVTCCPLCRTSAARPLSRACATIGLLQCNACGLVRATATYATGFLDQDYYGARAESFDGDAGFLRARKRWQLRLYDRLVNGRLSAPPRHARALDIGCGVGALLDVLADLGWDTHGVERSPTAAKTACVRHQIHDVDLENDAIDLGIRFDLVTATHVLEHLRDPVACLRLVARHLAPDARVLIEVPNWNDCARPLWGLHYRPLALGDHVSFFDHATLRATMQRAGLHVDTMWAAPQGATTVLPSVLTALDIVRRRARGLSRNAPLLTGVASESAAPRRTPASVRRALFGALDRLDPILEHLFGASGRRGANLVALARIAHAEEAK